MEQNLNTLLGKSNQVLILLPTRPFFDQVAAGLALYLSLSANRDVTIVSPSEMTVEFNRLVGVNRVKSEMGNKNLVIKFIDYAANDIERVSYDIEDGQFKLTVIPKPAVAAPEQNQVQFSYSGVASDTVILVGGTNDSHFPVLSGGDLSGANLIHIGTKSLSLSGGKQVVSLSRPGSSVSEVMANVIAEAGLPLEADVATNLLLGIEEGSNGFSQDTTADTFQIVSELMRVGGKRSADIPKAQATQFPAGAIPQNTQAKTAQPTVKTEAQDTSDVTEPAPQDWLNKPKIYKGTSIS